MDTPGLTPLGQPSPLGYSDQACKECRRRKSKCDKGIPTCNMCLRYRRHCLYEKYSRTPLTRKHLTEVEERLEQAEALIRQLRAALSHQTLLKKSPNSVDADELAAVGSDIQSAIGDQVHEDKPRIQPGAAHPVIEALGDTLYLSTVEKLGQSDVPASRQETDVSEKSHEDDFESPPSTGEFGWDEHRAAHPASPGELPASDFNETRQILDGMASLTVSEQQSGYLGIASGAAFLRLLEPVQAKNAYSQAQAEENSHFSLITLPNMNKHIADSMIDAYFRIYHVSYPIVHEPTFRAQYSEVIPRPSGGSWFILAYSMAALGVYTTATTVNSLDLDLFNHIKGLLSFDLLEIGSLALVQALTLISNYQQKRDKPNSAYSYSGLAARMAMALGLHKDFQGWKISPLSMEIRRRVWWTLSIFDIGANITFGRPQVCPLDGVDTSLPMNIHDKDLTAMSKSYPSDPCEISVYTAVRTQARFHIATNPIYIRIISKPLPSAKELLQLEARCLEPWTKNTPEYFSETASVPTKYAFAHSVMQWRWRNFRMIMYRPFVIRRALLARNGRKDNLSPESLQAYDRCLDDAKQSIISISDFWVSCDHIRLFAWYALYFLFQAALIPCICLRHNINSSQAPDLRDQIDTSLKVLASLVAVNPSARRCHQVIVSLCGTHLVSAIPLLEDINVQDPNCGKDASGVYGGAHHQISDVDGDRSMAAADNSHDQMDAVFSMMWPNALLDGGQEQDDSWMDFLNGI
ncbi:fungal-specific transcription factor domain-containing protein [Trichoderma austrokoningii]